MRRLIINADDYGYTAGVNRGIEECARAGTLTSATVMASGSVFAEAVRSGQAIGIGLGCHVVLVDGVPLSDPKQLSTLCPQGMFRRTLGLLMRDAISGQIAAEDVIAEATAQFKTLRDAGVTITHFDSHKHAHMFPAIYRPLLQAAKQSGIAAVRNPFEPFNPGWMGTPGLWVRGIQTTLLAQFRSGFLRAVHEVGLTTTDGTVGIAVTGQLDGRWLQRIVQGLPEGTWELVCHPGYTDDELQRAGTRLTASREVELRALTSDDFRRLLRDEGIELISYAEL